MPGEETNDASTPSALVETLAEMVGEGAMGSVTQFMSSHALKYPLIYACSYLEVPAVAMARLGQAAARDGLQGAAIQEAANLHPSNAERGAHRLFARWGLRLNIPISYLLLDGPVKTCVKVPYLKISDFLRHLIDKYPTAVFGGCSLKDAPKKCVAFWKGLYQSHYTHEVFDRFTSQDLPHVIPIVLHGDEGTGSKKQPIAIGCWETVFGLEDDDSEQKAKRPKFADCNHRCGLHPAKGNCCEVPPHWPERADRTELCLTAEDLEELMDQWHSSRGHSFLSRYLNYVIPTAWLDLGPWVLDGVHKALAHDLHELFYTGFSVGSQRWYVSIVALKGDAKWHVRTGGFDLRSYMRLGQIYEYGMCPDCRAGEEGYPFEQTGYNPAWVQTFGDGSLPWSEPGVFEAVPYDKKFPSWKFKRDPLHVFKIGLGRDIVGGIIMMLCKFFQAFDFPGDSRSVIARLERAHSRFSMWCSANSKTPHVRKFTKDFMHYSTSKSYAYTGSKGSDTMILLQWLSLELRLAIRKLGDHRRVDLLQAALQVCEASCSTFKLLYAHGLWLPRRCMAQLRDYILTVVRGYSYLACGCAAESFPAFKYKSTVHSFHHYAVELDIALQRQALCYPSLLLMDCSQAEDFVGRNARVARATHGKTVALRSLQRHLVKSKALLKRFRAKLPAGRDACIGRERIAC